MAAERRRGLARLGTVRVRTTVAAVVVAGLAMAVGGLALVAVLRGALTRELRTTARLRGQDVAELLAAAPAGRGLLAVNEADELLIQVLDERGRVVLASPNAQGMAPVARLRPGQSAEFEIPEAAPVEADGGFLAVATGADTPLGPRTVLVARSTEAVTEATAAVGGLLAVGLPLLLAVVAATTWVVVGRALAPVEAIRAEVDAISAAALHRRVQAPPADDEIGRLARTMNRMLGRLEQAQARQRRLVSDASHELRSPVAAIRQHVEVALAHPDRTTTAELAATVLAEDLRLQRLAEDLLLLTRADEHTLALRRRPVDLDDLVFDEARRLRASTGLRVDTTAVSAGRVDGDAAGLRRVLRNLGDNAARHAAGRLAFSLAETDGLVLLGVDDDGPGIPEADRRRVLERFVRLDDARARD
ncbi:MAG: ATP-binding protein, partial [Actinomycetes bacterium]